MVGSDCGSEKITVLVVGDRLDPYTGLLRDLELAGYQVASCLPDVILERIHAQPPALVLLAVDFSGDACLSAARALKADSALAGIFVAVLSDCNGLSAESGCDLAAYDLVVDGYVFLPLRREALLVLIRRFLRTRATLETLKAEEVRRRDVARLKSQVGILQYPAATVQELLDHALDEAIKLSDSRLGYIFFYDEDRRQFKIHAWSRGAIRDCDIPDPQCVYDLDKTGIWGEPVRQRKSIIVNDFQAPHPLKLGYPAGHVALYTYMTVPVFRGGRIVAVAGVANKEAGYTETDALHLSLLMDSIWQVVDRRMAEEALSQERRLLRTVIDNLPHTIYAKDQHARKTLANRADVASIGADSESEVLGKTDLDLFPDPVGTYLLADDQTVLQSGKPVLDREELLVDAHGRSRWMLTSKFPLRDGAGRIVGLVGTGRDITEQRQIESERQALLHQVEMQAHQLQQILETVPQGVVLLDNTGHVLLTNPTADVDLAVLASGSADRITRLGDRLLPELLTSPPKGLWHEVQTQGRIFEIIARPVTRDAAVLHWVMVINDATGERQVRSRLEQQERLAAVGQLAAGIAHDFNNIMAVIILYAQMVSQSGTVSGRDLERLATINEQARHATELIGQILDFSRRAALDRQTFDLRPLLKEQLRLLERTLPEDIRISFVHSDGDYTVDVDVTRIQQVIFNLAINARDAMPAGGDLVVTLARISVPDPASAPLPEMTPGEWIRMDVSDTGAGIPPDVLPRIFEPFFTTKEPDKGSGLGLAQVDGIIAQHGGHLTVATQVGVGTTFTIYLPVAMPSIEPGFLSEFADEVHGHGEVILVVEDNTALREAIAGTLERWHYRIREAANGVRALEILAETDREVNLVLSDVVMPEMGGIALVQAMHARHMRLPVILMTGHPRVQTLSELSRFGVSACVPKPLDVGLLSRALASALSGSTMESTTPNEN